MVSSIEELKLKTSSIYEKLSLSESPIDLKEYASNYNKFSTKIKNISLEIFDIKFKKVATYFDKIQMELMTFFEKQIVKVELEIDKINSPVCLNNMLLFQNSSILNAHEIREFVSIENLTDKQQFNLL